MSDSHGDFQEISEAMIAQFATEFWIVRSEMVMIVVLKVFLDQGEQSEVVDGIAKNCRGDIAGDDKV